MTTIAIRTAVIVAILAFGWYLAGRVNRWFALSPTVPVEDGGADDGQDDRPTSGADEEFGAELRAMRDGEVSPELISDVEVDLAWGLVWHEFEHAMQAEIDRAFAPVLEELQRPRSFDELRELVCPKELVAA